MKAEAILFLSKQQRVRAMHSADGKFALTMRAFDRSDPQHTEPWMLIFPGDAAAEFWQQHGDLAPNCACKPTGCAASRPGAKTAPRYMLGSRISMCIQQKATSAKVHITNQPAALVLLALIAIKTTARKL